MRLLQLLKMSRHLGLLQQLMMSKHLGRTACRAACSGSLHRAGQVPPGGSERVLARAELSRFRGELVNI